MLYLAWGGPIMNEQWSKHYDFDRIANLQLCVAGVGALYVRRRPRVRLEPLQSGGGQERGMRSGTVPTALAVGLGAACRIANQEMAVS